MTRLVSLSLLFVLAQQPQLWPQSNPFVEANRDEWRRAYAKLQPGPKLKAELDRLYARQRELRDLLASGALLLEEFSIESQRIEIHRHFLKSIALIAAPRDEVPELVVVLANHREIQRIFPLGKLPATELQPNRVYECEPGSARRVRYLSLFRWGGERFAVFAREQKN